MLPVHFHAQSFIAKTSNINPAQSSPTTESEKQDQHSSSLFAAQQQNELSAIQVTNHKRQSLSSESEQFNFQNLPTEIKNHIFELVLFPVNKKPIKTHLYPHHNLSLVCKSFKRQTHNLLYSFTLEFKEAIENEDYNKADELYSKYPHLKKSGKNLVKAARGKRYFIAYLQQNRMEAYRFFRKEAYLEKIIPQIYKPAFTNPARLELDNCIDIALHHGFTWYFAQLLQGAFSPTYQKIFSLENIRTAVKQTIISYLELWLKSNSVYPVDIGAKEKLEIIINIILEPETAPGPRHINAPVDRINHNQILEFIYKEYPKVSPLTDMPLNMQISLAFTATEHGYTEMVVKLLEVINIDAVDNNMQTLLHIAAKNGHSEIIPILLKKGINIDVADRGGLTPLFYAVREGHFEAMSILLIYGANINITELYHNHNHNLLLHAAAENGHSEILANLLQRNQIAIETKNSRDKSPLYCAVERGHSKAVDILLAHGADLYTTAYSNNLLHAAAQNGHSAILATLLQKEQMLPLIETKNYSDETPLYCAVKNDHSEIVTILLKYGADIYTKSKIHIYQFNLFHAAASYGHIKMITQLSELGLKFDENDGNNTYTPLDAALDDAQSNPETIATLVSLGFYESHNESALNSLHIIAKYGYTEAITDLTAVPTINGNGINQLDNRKNKVNLAPLHYAAKNGYSQIVSKLLELGANVNVTDSEGLTPLHYAIKNGYTEIIDVLIENGADVNIAP